MQRATRRRLTWVAAACFVVAVLRLVFYVIGWLS